MAIGKEYRKKRALLLKSEAIKDYGWLRELLENNEEYSQDSYEQLTDDQKDFMVHMFDTLVKQAVSEWKLVKDYPIDDLGEDREGWTTCSLCGTPNRYVFYIENVLNNNNLNVGSECKNQFGLGSDDPRSISTLRREAQRNRRLSELNKVSPGIGRKIDELYRKLDEFPIIIPSHLEKPYLDTAERLRTSFEAYLEGKSNDKGALIQEIKELLETLDYHQASIVDYVQNQKGNPLVPGREIKRFLQAEDNRQAIDMLKEDGLITCRTAHRITEPGFMKWVSGQMEKHLNKLGLSIRRIDPSRKGYILRIMRGQAQGIVILLRHDYFLLDYGGLLFSEPLDVEFTFRRIADRSQIFGEKSYYQALSILAKATERDSVKIWGYNWEFKEIVLYDRTRDRFLIGNLEDFVNEFKLSILELAPFDFEPYRRFCRFSTKEFDKEDFFDLERYSGQQMQFSS